MSTLQSRFPAWRAPVAILALCLTAGSVAVSPPVRAEPPAAALTFGVYVGGVHVLDTKARIALGAEHYRIEFLAAMDGFLGRLAPITAEVSATGAMKAGRDPAPTLYRSVATWRNEPRLTELRYTATSIDVIADPPPEKEREPVPQNLRTGTIDPLSAAVAVLVAIGQGRGCEATLPVFDGRQRYDLLFQPVGDEVLPPSDIGLYQGPALACSVALKPVAGAWRQRGRDRDDEPGRRRNYPMKVWVAEVGGGPPMPVRLEATTPFGTVLVHLTKYDRALASEGGDGSRPPG